MSEWQKMESWSGEWLERWECEQPDVGVPFVVVRDEWEDTDPPRRIIYEIRLGVTDNE